MKSVIINECMQKFNVRLSTASYVKCSKDWKQDYYLSPRSALGYIKEGEGYFMLEEEKFFPKKGQMYFLPEQHRHSFSVMNQENTFEKYYCHFNTMPGATNIFKVMKVPNFVTPRDPDYIEFLFKQMIEVWEQKEGYLNSLKIKILLYQVFEHYLEACDIDQIKIKHHYKQEALEEILKFIDENLDKKISLKEVAYEFGYSTQYFSKIFKKSLGITFLQYMNQLKMEKARELIMYSNKSMSEIAYTLGFENQYYFSNTFKKENGVSPTDYKKMYIKI